MAFPSIEEFDRSYADATPEQRDAMLETAQWMLQHSIADDPHPSTPVEEVLQGHELLFSELITILSFTLTAIRHERKEHHD